MESNKKIYNQISNYIYDLINNKQYSEAEVILEALVLVERENVELFNILGMVKYVQCKFTSAKEYFEASHNIECNEIADSYLNKYIDDEEEYIKFEHAIELCEAREFNKAIKELENLKKLKYDFIKPNILLMLLYYKNMKVKNSFIMIKNIKKDCKYTNITEFEYDIMKKIEMKLYTGVILTLVALVIILANIRFIN